MHLTLKAGVQIQGFFSHFGLYVALSVEEVLVVEWLMLPKEEETYISLKVTRG